MAAGLELNDLQGPFQSKPLYDSIMWFYELPSVLFTWSTENPVLTTLGIENDWEVK